jgi:hypothetical protein
MFLTAASDLVYAKILFFTNLSIAALISQGDVAQTEAKSAISFLSKCQ